MTLGLLLSPVYITWLAWNPTALWEQADNYWTALKDAPSFTWILGLLQTPPGKKLVILHTRRVIWSSSGLWIPGPIYTQVFDLQEFTQPKTQEGLGYLTGYLGDTQFHHSFQAFLQVSVLCSAPLAFKSNTHLVKQGTRAHLQHPEVSRETWGLCRGVCFCRFVLCVAAHQAQGLFSL